MNQTNNTEKIRKKRGRKPKGGKIVKCIEKNKKETIIPNIILHIKCSLKDIDSFDENIDIDSFQFDSKSDNLNYKIINNKSNDNEYITNNSLVNNNIVKPEISNIDKDIEFKLKELTINLHNNVINQKSACFWCTYNFDNLPIYIPKFEMENVYHCYGCFCSPECATAFLFKENIDSSKKFERY